jgi:hypothetical protein
MLQSSSTSGSASFDESSTWINQQFSPLLQNPDIMIAYMFAVGSITEDVPAA